MKLSFLSRLGACLAFGAFACAQAADYSESVAWANRLLKRGLGSLSRSAPAPRVYADLLSAEQAFQAILSKDPGNPAAEKGLAEARKALAKDKPELQSYLNASSADSIERANQRILTAAQAGPHLLAITGQYNSKSGALTGLILYHFRQVNAGQQTDSMPINAYPLEKKCVGAEIRLLSNRDGQPTIALIRLSLKSSEGDTSHLLATTISGTDESARLMGSFDSDTPAWIEDLNKDGKPEIGVSKRVGYYVAFKQQPLWTDIYAMMGDKLKNDNKTYAYLLAPSLKTLQAMLPKHRLDYGVLMYLAQAYDLNKKPSTALDTYKKAKNALLLSLKEEINAEAKRLLQADQKFIDSQIALLSSRASKAK